MFLFHFHVLLSSFILFIYIYIFIYLYVYYYILTQLKNHKSFNSFKLIYSNTRSNKQLFSFFKYPSLISLEKMKN